MLAGAATRSVMLIALLLVVLVAAGAARAGGLVLDQHFIGNPDCTYESLRGSISSGGPSRQEFVPEAPVLLAAELCLSFTGGEEVTLNIRSGTAKAPGDTLASMTVNTPMTGAPAFVQFAFDATFVEPGATYVLEIPQSPDFAWLATCAEPVPGYCDDADPDPYPQGGTNFDGVEGFESLGKFGFRTYSGPFPGSLVWGDDDCNLATNAVDALKTLQEIAALPYTQEQPCPGIGVSFTVATAGVDGGIPWGDIDCGGDVDSVDALQILRHVAALQVNQEPGCPGLGDEVVLGP